VKKFKNIENYYSYIETLKKRGVPTEDPYGEENWDDEEDIRIDLNNLDKDLKDFLFFMTKDVINTFDIIFESEEFIVYQFLRKNKDLILKFKDIKKFLDDNFYITKDPEAKIGFYRPSLKSRIKIHLKKESFLRDKINLSLAPYKNLRGNPQLLSYIIDTFDIIDSSTADWYEEDDPYSLTPHEISFYWISTTKNLKL